MAVSFKGAHFPQEIILPCVRWYAWPIPSARAMLKNSCSNGVST